MAPATKRGFCEVENSSAGLAGEARRGHVQLTSLRGEPELGQHDGRALKAIGFDDVGAGFEIPDMDVANPIRARDAQIFVAIFEMRAAEIGRGGVVRLEHGAHGAVENQDALSQRVF